MQIPLSEADAAVKQGSHNEEQGRTASSLNNKVRNDISWCTVVEDDEQLLFLQEEGDDQLLGSALFVHLVL